MTLIDIHNLTVAYHGQVALYDASLTVEQGDFIGIVGENGSGKTTLLKAILDLVAVQDGTIERAEGLKIGYVPQYIGRQDYIFPATAKEVVRMGLLSEKKGFKRFTKEDNDRVDALFELLHIDALKHKRIGELSGGQQQRVLLARALVHEPDLLILDEPTSALDKLIQQSFLGLLKEMNQDRQMTILIVTHDLAGLGDYVQQLVYLDKTVVFSGTFRDFCQNAALSPYIHTHDIKGCDAP